MAEMKIPLLDLKAEYRASKEELLAAIAEVLDGMSLYLGPNLRAVEETYGRYARADHTLAVSSGTDALLLAYLALDVKPGDEVVVPSHTFIATMAPLHFLGAKPVFVDIDPVTYNLDPALVEAAVTDRTVGIVPVHLYGHAAPMDEIVAIARRKNLWVVEDACQAVGTSYKGRHVGTQGDIGCFSFVFTKNLKTYGEAGGITTQDRTLADRMARLRDHGRADKYVHPSFGLNARMSEIEAAILRVQLKHVEARAEARRRNARFLSRALRGGPVGVPEEASYTEHAWHQYVVRAPRRAELVAHLDRAGVATGIHYPIPCHLQEAARPYSKGPGSLPHTERAAHEVLSLPVYPELSEEQLERIAGAVLSFAKGG